MKKTLLTNLSYSAFLSLDFGSSGYGSGFKLIYKENVYLITAKHVLFNELGERRCKELLITSKDYKGEDAEGRTIIIDMTKALVSKNENADVAIVLLETKFISEDYITVQQEGHNIISVDSGQTRNLNEIKLANEVFLVGCPTSLIGQNDDAPFDVDRPLLRKGIIAGINYKDKNIIIDCSSYYGNSGGPIIEISEDGIHNIVGVVLRYIPFSTEWRNNRETKISHIEFSNSGYSVCAPMDEIFNLMDTSNSEYLILTKKEFNKNQF